ncbi:HNH endonuclease family protein [Actinokineospora sp. PR83]|uniref:HNH endonuclease family protein n=1 Tax=Actinokineospora sp. PR83 TaxID=2884908 RepID=UPI0027E1F243|nr:DUF1524 domain-containing protein [Actinokineospora sp. PR83]MCG8916016.1 HNH endonuclease family protein [Actinokineospora sp. PR83]
MAKRGKTTWVSLVVALVVLVVGIWWSQLDEGTPTGADAQRAIDQLAKLTVAVEDTGLPYNREDWPHWSARGDGCDTREEALKAQGRSVRTDVECKAMEGTWTSPYDGTTITDARQTDLDHLVPLAEANRSGTRGWTREQRRAFANDLDQLIVVSARSNRQKGDQDPAHWLPDAAYSCDYAVRWVLVKAKYNLTVDQAEHDTLASLLSRCPR